MGFQNQIIATSLPSFPWNVGDQLDAVPLNNAIIALQNQLDSQAKEIQLIQYNNSGSSVAGTSITLDWGGYAPVTLGPYVITPSASLQFTIDSAIVYVGTNAGLFEFTVNIDGKPIDGLTNATVQNPAKTTILVTGTNNTVPRGGQLDVQITNILGAPENAYICLVSAGATVVPILGVGQGNCFGSSTAFATTTVNLSAISNAVGTSSMFGVGVTLVFGQGIASASGTSLANGVGTSTSVLPTLALDIGALDINPLG